MARDETKAEAWEAVVPVEICSKGMFRGAIWTPSNLGVRRGVLGFVSADGRREGCFFELAPPGRGGLRYRNWWRLVVRKSNCLCTAGTFVCVDDRTVHFEPQFPEWEEIDFRIAEGAAMTSHEIKRIWTRGREA